MKTSRLDPKAFPADFPQRILARCIEVGDCLEWTGTYTGALPVVMVPRECLPDSKMRPGLHTLYVSVRRALVTVTRGVDAGARIAVPRCDNPKCVRVDHISALTKQDHARRMSKHARSTDLARGRRISATKRSKTAKLTAETVREIRESNESYSVLSKRHGVARSFVSRIKRWEVWRDYATPMGSMADQLARAA